MVEVADATLSYDRSVERRMYARDGLTAYWIINLIDHQVEVHTEASGPVDPPSYALARSLGGMLRFLSC